MKERPIIFSDAMIRAINDRRKTQTRLAIGLPEFKASDTPGYDWTWRGQAPLRSIAQQRRYAGGCWQDVKHDKLLQLCPYGKVGDRLWVKESHYVEAAGYPDGCGRVIRYRATDQDATVSKWTSPMFMPRWASRLTLEITDVRVERVQDIGKDGRRAADVLAEGLTRESFERLGKFFHADDSPAMAYSVFWNSINANRGYPWLDNPWVFAVGFKVI